MIRKRSGRVFAAVGDRSSGCSSRFQNDEYLKPEPQRLIPKIPNVPDNIVEKFFDRYPLLLFFAYDKYHGELKDYVNKNIKKIDERSGNSCLFWFPYLEDANFYLENILDTKTKESKQEVTLSNPYSEISFLKETFGLRQNELPCIIVSEPGQNDAFIIKIDLKEYDLDQLFDLIISAAEKAKNSNKKKRTFHRTFNRESKSKESRNAPYKSALPLIQLALQAIGIAF